MPVGETQTMDGSYLNGLWKMAEASKLEPMLAVSDRDSSTSFYRLRVFVLDGKRFYGLEWVKL